MKAGNHFFFLWRFIKCINEMLKSMTQAVHSICRYMRMSPESFDCILREIAPDISKKSTEKQYQPKNDWH